MEETKFCNCKDPIIRGYDKEYCVSCGKDLETDIETGNQILLDRFGIPYEVWQEEKKED